MLKSLSPKNEKALLLLKYFDEMCTKGDNFEIIFRREGSIYNFSSVLHSRLHKYMMGYILDVLYNDMGNAFMPFSNPDKNTLICL